MTTVATRRRTAVASTLRRSVGAASRRGPAVALRGTVRTALRRTVLARWRTAAAFQRHVYTSTEQRSPSVSLLVAMILAVLLPRIRHLGAEVVMSAYGMQLG